MIVTRLKMPLEQVEYSGLLKIADNELRNPVDQMRIILRQELERRGLLSSHSDNPKTEPMQEGEHV